MSYRNVLWEVALGQHGYVTTADAAAVGVPGVELPKLAARGAGALRLRRVGRGVYRFGGFPDSGVEPFMEAVLCVGPRAHLRADAVLALHGLASVNPRRIQVGTPDRVRRTVPAWVRAVTEHVPPGDLTRYESVPSTTVAAALRACRGLLEDGVLAGARDQARAQGLLTARDVEALAGSASA